MIFEKSGPTAEDARSVGPRGGLDLPNGLAAGCRLPTFAGRYWSDNS